MSREALAVAADLSYEMIRRIETGKSKTRTDTAHRLAAALGVGLTDLFPPSSPAPAEPPSTPAPQESLVAPDTAA
ncbi:MAG: helix-turn-helix domain-containing protein [Vicinamibacteria bacterium]|nr:helix-turn-helix domain-containing protein [Vicinamibacteria bacterium]